MTTAAQDGPSTGALARGAWHLGRARREAGRSVESLAADAGMSPEELRLAEAGWRAITEDEKERLAAALDLTAEQLVPPRMPVQVDPAGQRLLMGAHSIEVGQDRRGTLASYLSLVYASRGAKPGDRIQLRDDDLDALAALVGDDAGEIESYLVELMGCSPEEARRLGALLLRRRVVGAAAGFVFTVGAIAGLTHRTEPGASLASVATEPTVGSRLDAASSASQERALGPADLEPASVRTGATSRPLSSWAPPSDPSALTPTPDAVPVPVPVPVRVTAPGLPAGDPGPLLSVLVPPLPERPAAPEGEVPLGEIPSQLWVPTLPEQVVGPPPVTPGDAVAGAPPAVADDDTAGVIDDVLDDGSPGSGPPPDHVELPEQAGPKGHGGGHGSPHGNNGQGWGVGGVPRGKPTVWD